MIAREHSERYLFALLWPGFFFISIIFWWVIPFPGNTMQIVRGITGSLNTSAFLCWPSMPAKCSSRSAEVYWW